MKLLESVGSVMPCTRASETEGNVFGLSHSEEI